MFLQKLEIQGFKSFANKTFLEFPKIKNGQSITAVVGPNGSGKSCIADSIRWVLGEQSTKLLRAKKNVDVIFSGSEKKSRSGFAEVMLYLDNTDRRADIDYTELAIGRRLYQSGENEYFLNKSKTRLQDILMLLAQANFGQRTYSVIGQGMVDAVLMQSPRERKEFFDEAAGVRQFQLKRQASINKLNLTEENLKQVEVLLNEIRPRLRTLSRHVSKLEQFDEMKGRLHSLEHAYYGNLWHKLQNSYAGEKRIIDSENKKLTALNAEIAELQKKFEQTEKKETASEELMSLQNKYAALINKKNDLREKEFVNKEKITTLRLQQSAKKEIPQATIILELDQINKEYQKIINNINEKTNPLNLKTRLEEVLNNLDGLSKKIKNPAGAIKIPEELTVAIEAIARDMQKADAEIKNIQQQIDVLRSKQKTETAEFFDIQHKWRERVETKNSLERNLSNLRIELAKIETKKEALEQEMETHLKERKEMVLKNPPQEQIDPSSIENEMQNLRYQLELVGSIDPETVKEYKETKERFDFLDSQSNDLAQTSKSLKEIIKQLDEQMQTQFDAAFHKINAEFGKYFSMLFGGGKARLEIVEMETQKHESTILRQGYGWSAKESSSAEATGDRQEQENEDNLSKDTEEQTGVEIFANPPGKKVKSVGMLSGGERALISIALICAIVSNNPSPFVVLDEVDAALDESNSVRFSEIIRQLAGKTQFILITHNRATMGIADLLYGITMGDDGVSQLLSLKLEEAEGLVNR